MSVTVNRDGVLRPAEQDARLMTAMLPSPCPQNHAANLLPLPDGSLLCVWFGGTQEGVADISVYSSRLAPGADRWSEAVKLSDDPARSEQNPVLFLAPDGVLWLLWTAQLAGNQDTAIVRMRQSRDLGADRDAARSARHLYPPADYRAGERQLAAAGVLLPHPAGREVGGQ